MQYVQLMKALKSGDHLDYCLPDILLFVVLFIILILADALENIAIVCELHHYAKWIARFIEKGLFVPRHKRIFNWCKYAYFIQSVFFLSIWEILNCDFLESVDLIVFDTTHLVYAWIWAVTYKYTNELEA